MSNPEDLIAEFRRLAAHHEAEARRIEAMPTGGRASSTLGTVVVSDSGAILQLELTNKVNKYSPTEASERIWRLYQDAVADAARANLFATQGELSGVVEAPGAELRDEQVAEEVADEGGEIGAPGDQAVPLESLGPDSHPSPEVAAASADEAMELFRREIEAFWAEAEAGAASWSRLRGRGQSPRTQPVAIAVVDGAGAPVELRLTAAAAGMPHRLVNEHLVTALAEAADHIAEESRAEWSDAGAHGDPFDAFPLRGDAGGEGR